MFDLKKLKADVTRLVKEVELAYNEMEEAGKTNDETAQEAAKQVFEAKTAEFDALNTKVAAAESHQARLALKAKVEMMAQPADPVAAAIVQNGVTGVVGSKVAATPIDPMTAGFSLRSPSSAMV